MTKLIKWLYHTEIRNNYSGQGYLQGIGFSLETKVIKICGIQFISEIKITTDLEWIRNLKRRWKEDDEQQLRENK